MHDRAVEPHGRVAVAEATARAHGHMHGRACDRASTPDRVLRVILSIFDRFWGFLQEGVSRAPQLGFLSPSLKPH